MLTVKPTDHFAANLASLQPGQWALLSDETPCTITELTIDRTRYRSRHDPEPSVSWSVAVTRLHQRIANAKRIEDGPELFEALRGEP